MSATDIAQSLLSYVGAPELEKRCLLAIAARTYPDDLAPFAAIFRAADGDGDGRVSCQDMARWLDRAPGLFPCDVSADVLFAALDVFHHGYISFSEFCAACIYERLAPLDFWLARETFESLDIDGDGFISAADVEPMFTGALKLGELPSRRALCLDEWCEFLLRESGGFMGVGAIAEDEDVYVLEEPVSPTGAAGSARTCGHGCTFWPSIFGFSAKPPALGALPPLDGTKIRPRAAPGVRSRGVGQFTRQRGSIDTLRLRSGRCGEWRGRDCNAELSMGIFGSFQTERALSSPPYVPVAVH
eukprot:TRINITY_DN40500_c0_g1_i1.p1 TRINITY_DN40500_c0_g1~~TRINITY_DN40500_c0_g1_i1.p1  ORF type:complete len:331 (-),score=64.90 TRINITY_DN40500_c0_g1_i1:96-998(-)